MLITVATNKAGRYDNITLSQYHKMPAYSKSALDKINQSMAHYFEAITSPKEQTPQMLLGSAFHCRTLTPDIYMKEYVVAPECDKRTKIGKETYAEFEELNAGKTILSFAQAATAECMAKAVLEHPIASRLLTDGDAEHSFFWTDPRTGLPCKARPDYLRRDGIIIDLKSTADASYYEFQRTIVNFRYHVQGAFFGDGVTSVTGEKRFSFILIAVESSAPYAVAIYRIDDDGINIGRTAYGLDLDKVVAYEKDKSWAGYTMQIQEMILPPWAA